MSGRASVKWCFARRVAPGMLDEMLDEAAHRALKPRHQPRPNMRDLVVDTDVASKLSNVTSPNGYEPRSSAIASGSRSGPSASYRSGPEFCPGSQSTDWAPPRCQTRTVLTPIEFHLRTGDDPSAWILVIRGRPLTTQGLLVTAARTAAEFSWRGNPLAAVSAEVTGPDRSTEDVLAGPRLRTRRTYATTPVGDLLAAGFPVLATFDAPHVSVVLPEYDELHVRALIEIFGPDQPNPFYMRTMP